MSEILQEVNLVYKDNNSHKFYNLTIKEDGTNVYPFVLDKHWGKVGTSGQHQFKHYPSIESAKKALEVVRRSKVGKGYKSITKIQPSSPPKKKASKKLAKAWAEDQWDIL